MTPSQPNAKRSSAAPPSGGGSALWIGIVVVVVLLGVVAVVVSRNANDDPVANQTSKVSESAEGASDGNLPVYDATTDDPAVGMTIPTVTGQDFDGNDITIGPDGKAKIIIFVAHWCPHCQREVPMLKAHLDEVPMPDDVELLTVSTGVKPGAENYPPAEWLDREGWSAPVLADDENSSVAAAYGLKSFPYFVVVDADGKVVVRTSGEISAAQFDAAVEAAQTGQA